MLAGVEEDLEELPPPPKCMSLNLWDSSAKEDEPSQPAETEWDCIFTHHVRWHKAPDGTQCVNEYVLGKELGHGSYSRVRSCERRVSTEPPRTFAMKIMSKARLRKLAEYVNTGLSMRKVTAEDKVRREIEIMRHLYHRNGKHTCVYCSLHAALQHEPAITILRYCAQTNARCLCVHDSDTTV
jgi:serine/threonine protein kinase